MFFTICSHLVSPSRSPSCFFQYNQTLDNDMRNIISCGRHVGSALPRANDLSQEIGVGTYSAPLLVSGGVEG